MGKVVRESVLEGVKLRVTPKKNSFDVEVIIPKGRYLPKKASNRLWSISIKKTDENRIFEEKIRVKFTDQKYPKKDLNYTYKKVIVLCDSTEVRICIQPAFYLNQQRREKFWKKREEREKAEQAKRQSYVGICTRVGGSSRTRTNYTRNNLFKPYQGGKCSPK